MNTKKELGLYYTTNVSYIFQNIPFFDTFSSSSSLHVIEPFVGNGDILTWCTAMYNNNNNNINTIPIIPPIIAECYDIRPLPNTIQQNTLLYPPIYKHKYVITNPPFLAHNKKNTIEHIQCFKKYPFCNDLYKCFIMSLIDCGPVEGGILIVPLNFWCSLCTKDILLRQLFVKMYIITHMNIFYERVFKDTTCSICSFRFIKKEKENEKVSFIITCYPSKQYIVSDAFTSETFYLLKGGLFIHTIISFRTLQNTPTYTIKRITQQDVSSFPSFFLLCQVIDMSLTNKINIKKTSFFIKNNNKTSRAYMYISIANSINNTLLEEHVYDKICILFNTLLTTERDNSLSLFLSSYREYYRKRLSFTLLYDILYYIIHVLL
jgi:hypothetical protein